MSKISVKFDDNLPKNDIIAVLTDSSTNEAGNEFMKKHSNNLEIQQTSIYGIKAPLISINNVTVNFTDIKYFSLKNSGRVPQLYMEVYDRYRLTTSIDTPGPDNNVTIQIIPPFDNAYKKINLNFYVSDIDIVKGTNLIKIKGSYKVIDLISKQFKSLGEVSTYETMELIAKTTKLGFATNCENNVEDKRYIYCCNESYIDLLNKEIKYSLSNTNTICDFWVDYWNYLNFVNIYERYTTIEDLNSEENKIWISASTSEISEGIKHIPRKSQPLISNHPALINTQLYVKDYEILNKLGGYYSKGTDIVYSIYEENKKEYIDHFYQNEDVQDDIFVGLEYKGEVYGDYNYLLSEVNRDVYIKKMNIETVKVILNNPLLSLKKGDKIDFMWYNHSLTTGGKYGNYIENGIMKDINDVQTNIPINDELPDNLEKHINSSEGNYEIDRSISGQYMILNNNIYYKNNTWFYELTLGRPRKDKPEILNKEK